MNSMPASDSSKDLQLTHVSVQVYDTPGEPCHWFNVPLTNGQLVFCNNKAFGTETDFPVVPFHVYDVYREEFVVIATFSTMDLDPVANPWLLLRNSGFTDDDCPDVGSNIGRLLHVVDGELAWCAPTNPPTTPSPPSQSQKRLHLVDGSPEPKGDHRLKCECLSWEEVIDLTLEIELTAQEVELAMQEVDKHIGVIDLTLVD